MKQYQSVGVSSTRKGLSDKQKLWLDYFVENTDVKVLHHGDCVGGDDEIAQAFDEFDSYIIAHPAKGVLDSLRANSKVNDLVLPPQHPLVRNRTIVDHSILFLAFPATLAPVLHSGTWSAIRYAKRRSKNMILIPPTGARFRV